MVLAGLAASSPARLFKPAYLLCYGIGRASLGFPGFLSLGQWPGQWPMAGLTEAFGPGFDPGIPWSDQGLDAREVSGFIFSENVLIF